MGWFSSLEHSVSSAAAALVKPVRAPIQLVEGEVERRIVKPITTTVGQVRRVAADAVHAAESTAQHAAAAAAHEVKVAENAVESVAAHVKTDINVLEKAGVSVVQGIGGLAGGIGELGKYLPIVLVAGAGLAAFVYFGTGRGRSRRA